jgi:tetratricopeptide (TPR) repeat protein
MKLLNTLFATATATALLTVATPAVWAQAAAPAAAASAPTYSVRPEVGAALNQAVDLFRAGKPAEARERVEKAQLELKDLTPVEVTVMHRLRGLFSLQLDQPAEAVKSLEAAVAVNAQSVQDQLICLENLARAHFNAKSYPAAIDWAKKAQAAGSKSAPVQSVLVRASYSIKDYPGAIALLEAQEKRDGKLSMEDTRLLASSYGLTKDDANYVRLSERLLREHGRTELWPDLLTRVQRQPGWQERWDVDFYRLRHLLDQMDEANDYLALADMVSRAGLPAEAQQVLEAGWAKGMLGKGPKVAEQQKFRDAVTKQAADDRQSLAAAGARPVSVGDARSATNTFNTGLAMVTSGLADKGLDLMKAALTGPLADPAQARLQYGQALHKAGRTAEAVEQFKALSANESLGLLARLWQAAVSPVKKS